jgi:hypothetical protein
MLIYIFIMLFTFGVISREFGYLPINLSKVTTYANDRVVFQRIEKFSDLSKDHSFESLLIIKKSKMYLFMDGYDSEYTAKARKVKIILQKVYGENEADLVWTNKINGKPDYIQITDRHSQVMLNTNEEFVSTNFGAFYKSIRDKFIREHISKFHQLMRNRQESNFYVEVKMLPRPLYLTDFMKYPDKFYIFAKARAVDGTTYTCEDADGDGVTETFLVEGHDGFNWGYQSGPNLICIYKNTDKDIETLIGKLANESVYGSVEDEKEMIGSFPKEKDIDDLIKWLTPKDPNIK